jgi:glucose uptake protein GlcU
MLRLCQGVTIFTTGKVTDNDGTSDSDGNTIKTMELEDVNAPTHSISTTTTTIFKQRLGQGRHPCHVYLDYAISYVLVGSVVLPLVSSLLNYYSSSHGLSNEADATADYTTDGHDDRTLLHYLSGGTGTSTSSSWLLLVLVALLGGSLLALGNLTTQWSTTAFGAPLTTVLALQASTCVIVGTYWNYKLQPDRIRSPTLLLVGVAVFIVAIICSVLAQSGYQQQEQHPHQQPNKDGQKQQNKIISSLNDEEEATVIMYDNDMNSSAGMSLPLYHLYITNRHNVQSSHSFSSITVASSADETGLTATTAHATTANVSGDNRLNSNSSGSLSKYTNKNNGPLAFCHSESTHSLCSYGSIVNVNVNMNQQGGQNKQDPGADDNDGGNGNVGLSNSPPHSSSVALSSSLQYAQSNSPSCYQYNQRRTIPSEATALDGTRTPPLRIPSCVQLPMPIHHEEEREQRGDEVPQPLAASTTLNPLRSFILLSKTVSMLGDNDNQDLCDDENISSASATATGYNYTYTPVVKSVTTDEGESDEEAEAKEIHDSCSYSSNTRTNQSQSNSTSPSNKNVTMGILIALFGGTCFGFFSPLFNIAVNDPFGWSSNSNSGTVEDASGSTSPSGLSVSTANSLFALAFAFSSVLWNLWLMTYPPTVGQVLMPQSSWKNYISKERMSDRMLALTAGALCGVGNALQFQGGALAGFAAADMVQAFPLVATLLDVLVFGEFRSASRRILAILAAMYISYLSGMICLASSISL